MPRQRIVLILFITISGVLVAAFAVLLGFQNLGAFVTHLRDLIFAVAQIFAMLLLIALIVMLLRWMSGKGEGTVILPFDNATGEPKYDGKAVSDSLIAELHRIRRIHLEEHGGIPPEILTLPELAPRKEENLAASIENVGTVGLGETTVSIGRLLVTLKRLWPWGEPGTVITGSLQKYGPMVRLVARREQRTVSAWEVSRKIESDDQIPELIRDLAFKIARDLSEESLPAKTWAAFKEYTAALDCYSNYIHTGRVAELEGARTSCAEAIRAEPGYVTPFELLYNIGLIYFKGKDYATSEAIFRDGLTLGQNRKSEDMLAFFSGDAESLSNLPDRKEDAIAAYLKVVQLDPRNAAARYNLGVQYQDLRRMEDAIAAYLQVIKIDPKHAQASYNLGIVYKDLGRLQEAIGAFQKARELAPQDADPWRSLGEAYQDLGHSEEAIGAYQKAIELAPTDGVASWAWYNLGTVYEDLGRSEDAISAYEKAHELGPSDADPWQGLGEVYQALGRHAEASAAYREAIKLAPTDGDHWRGLGEVCQGLGRTEEASAAYQKAIVAYRETIRLAPTDADLWRGLSKAYHGLGRTEEAIAAEQKAVELEALIAPAP